MRREDVYECCLCKNLEGGYKDKFQGGILVFDWWEKPRKISRHNSR